MGYVYMGLDLGLNFNPTHNGLNGIKDA